MANRRSNGPYAGFPIVVRLCSVLAVGLATPLAWANEASSGVPAEQAVKKDDSTVVNPYSDLSDKQLGALAETFEDLGRDQRRWFLTEVRKRMSSKGKKPRIPVVESGGFGRVVRKVGRTDQTPPDIGNTRGGLPSGEQSDESKVYGTGFRPQRKESSDGSVPALLPEGPSSPNE